MIDGALIKNNPCTRLSNLNTTIEELRASYSPSPLPSDTFQNIGVITGYHSKARDDFTAALKFCVGAKFFKTRLSRPSNVARAIGEACDANPDILVVTRGGGATIELAVFDEPEVLRALARASNIVPVILAVGHASDSLKASEFVSDVCTTPSAAGSRVRALYYRNKKRPKAASKMQSDELAAARKELETAKRAARAVRGDSEYTSTPRADAQESHQASISLIRAEWPAPPTYTTSEVPEATHLEGDQQQLGRRARLAPPLIGTCIGCAIGWVAAMFYLH